MIVGGQTATGTESKTQDKAYALSLDPDVEVPSCLSSICDIPHYAQLPSGAVFEDKLPVICGGRDCNTNPCVYLKECYKFNFSNAWEYTGSKNYGNIHTGIYSTTILEDKLLIPNDNLSSKVFKPNGALLKLVAIGGLKLTSVTRLNLLQMEKHGIYCRPHFLVKPNVYD